MDLGNLATPELWAIMLEKQRPDSGSLCGPEARLLLTVSGCIMGGSSPSSLPPPPSRCGCPCLGASGPENLARPSLPASGTHLKRTMFIVTRDTSYPGLKE